MRKCALLTQSLRRLLPCNLDPAERRKKSQITRSAAATICVTTGWL